MSDVIDIANDRADLSLQAALNNRVRFEGVSATHCEECGDEIPEGRRKALPGVKTCAECANLAELRGRN